MASGRQRVIWWRWTILFVSSSTAFWLRVLLLLFVTHNIVATGDLTATPLTTRAYGSPSRNNSRGRFVYTQRNNHANISLLLDNLLRGYDNSVRPEFGGPPAIVEVDIMVRSMGPISEVDMTYSMDCYFRQSWVDRRLAFKGAQDTLALSITMLKRIWKPDTYFYNGKQSYLHTITTPNKFVRLYQDGRVLYSSRLTIKAGCPMSLENFPMDTQKCPLKFGSFGYTNRDVIYRWNPSRQVAIAEDMKLSQFDLVDCPAGNTTDRVVHNLSDPPPQHQQQKQTQLQRQKPKQRVFIAEYSMLVVSFHLQRHMGNFLIQVYGPCILLVVLSWVSFWLNREATADRVSLGITTVLTMTFLGLEARTDLPKVPYPTALDFFVFMSFAFIFATILQFAFVHYFTKYGSGECYFSAELCSESESDDEGHGTAGGRRVSAGGGGRGRVDGEDELMENSSSSSREKNRLATDVQLYEVIPLSVCSVNSMPVKNPSTSYSIWSFLFCMNKNNKTHIDSVNATPLRDAPSLISGTHHAKNIRSSFSGLSNHTTPRQNGSSHRRRRPRRAAPRFNSVSKIDRASRVLFPLTFLLINLFYWHSYLYRNAHVADQMLVCQLV